MDSLVRFIVENEDWLISRVYYHTKQLHFIDTPLDIRIPDLSKIILHLLEFSERGHEFASVDSSPITSTMTEIIINHFKKGSSLSDFFAFLKAYRLAYSDLINRSENSQNQDEFIYLSRIFDYIELLISNIWEKYYAIHASRFKRKRYSTIFREIPISIWEADYSEMNRYLKYLRQKKIKDFRAHFIKYPEDLDICAEAIKIIDINQTTLNLYQAKNKIEFLRNINDLYVTGHKNDFMEEVIAFAENNTFFEVNTHNITLKGQRIYINKKVTALSNYKDSLSRVLISITPLNKSI